MMTIISASLSFLLNCEEKQTKLWQCNKNTLHLQSNCMLIMEEIEGWYSENEKTYHDLDGAFRTAKNYFALAFPCCSNSTIWRPKFQHVDLVDTN